MIGVIRFVVARVIAGMLRLWTLIRRAAFRLARSRRVAPVQNEIRRRYAFGAISRETFDAAMRKAGRRRRAGRRGH
jgi:hypothetical protein